MHFGGLTNGGKLKKDFGKITNAVKFRAAVAQTLHHLLKTLHKCFNEFVKHCNSEYSLNLY